MKWTDNHTKVLSLAAMGDTAEMTAERMGISAYMVQAYRKEVRMMLDRPSLTSAIVPAIRAGLLSIDTPEHRGYVAETIDPGV
jgi:DNA-binding CsgD family transcriptional regulator